MKYGMILIYEITIVNASDGRQVIDVIPHDRNFLFQKANTINELRVTLIWVDLVRRCENPTFKIHYVSKDFCSSWHMLFWEVLKKKQFDTCSL